MREREGERERAQERERERRAFRFAVMFASSTVRRVSCARGTEARARARARTRTRTVSLSRAHQNSKNHAGCHLTTSTLRRLQKSRRCRHSRGRRGFHVCANAFGNLTRRLDDTWRKVKGVDELTPENLKEPLKDIRRALLEADVSLTVVRKFIKNVEKKAVGASVVRGLAPDETLVKVVRDELVR